MSAGMSDRVGAEPSTAVTVTMTMAEAAFMHSSVTVRVTAFGPTSSQSKDVTSKLRVTSPQPS